MHRDEIHELARALALTGEELLAGSQNTTDVSIPLSLVRALILEARWEDLRFPAQGINPAGTAAPPSIDTTAYPGTMLFSPSSDNIIAGIAQMPHAWWYGTALTPHVHWRKPVADVSELAVAWRMKYCISAIDAAPTAWTDWLDATLVAGNLADEEHHNLSNFPTIDMTGYMGSVCIHWQLMRDVSEDAYSSDARLLEFDIHYQQNKLGSILAIPSAGDY